MAKVECCQVEERWLKLNKRYRICDDTSRHWWSILSGWYDEPQRHYHTLQHISDMFVNFSHHELELKQPDLVAFAIYFHDIIYDPKSTDNEEKSAELFMQFCESGLRDMDQCGCDQVFDWILQTKNHSSNVDDVSGDGFQAEDVNYFMDFDMAVLGWSQKDYKVYAGQIRQEYIHIDETTYRTKRAQVLKHFLEKERIYCTEKFYSLYEEQARQNIMDEIDDLENG